jgi:hypothetical protein
MKKKSSRRRTKMVRRSKKNPRRTIKRKNIRKSGRRPTRRYSRIQGGGDPYIDYVANIANKLYEEAMAIKTSSSPLNRKDISNIYKMLLEAARTGHKNANYELGKIYEEESKKEKEKRHTLMEIDNINWAIKKYAIAAIQGHLDAKSALERLIKSESEAASVQLYTVYTIKNYINVALAAVGLVKTYSNIETGENALDEVKKFKETLEKIGEKAPEQSVIAGADTGVD